MSADLYSDLTIGLGMKNYPKLTPHMPQSIHWFKSYGDFFQCQLICTVTSLLNGREILPSISADLYGDVKIYNNIYLKTNERKD